LKKPQKTLAENSDVSVFPIQLCSRKRSLEKITESGVQLYTWIP
jgi:hypothetical protein